MDKVIEAIDKLTAEYEDKIATLYKTRRLLIEHERNRETKTEKLIIKTESSEPEPKITKPKPRRNEYTPRPATSSTGEKGIGKRINPSTKHTTYRVNVYDKYLKKLIHDGSFLDLNDAIKKRDLILKEIDHRKEHICDYGWKCDDCGEEYFRQLKPVVCKKCSSRTFVKRTKENESQS